MQVWRLHGPAGERESPYLSRRDKLAWDLDKRETRGAQGLGENSQVSGGEGKQTACGFKEFYLEGG